MRRHRRQERQRRDELEGIAALGDINELSISGHVDHEPVLGEDDYGVRVCRFVLIHTTTGACNDGWERQRYTVTASGELGEYYAANWQPGHTIIIDGHLEHEVCQTLAGPLPSIWIVAHTIDTALGPHPHTHNHQKTGG